MVRSAVMAGVRGRRETVIIVAMATGKVCCVDGSRQGVVPVRLLGDIVRVIA